MVEVGNTVFMADSSDVIGVAMGAVSMSVVTATTESPLLDKFVKLFGGKWTTIACECGRYICRIEACQGQDLLDRPGPTRAKAIAAMERFVKASAKRLLSADWEFRG